MTNDLLRDTAVQILYRAVESKIGLIIEVSEPLRAKAVLYRVRAELNDPLMKNLQIRHSATNVEKELWIIKMDENYNGGRLKKDNNNIYDENNFDESGAPKIHVKQSLDDMEV